jgi:single-stranded-DNA-specific exonuclease
MNLARKLNQLLPYVAIGTVADCQSILEPTNRLLVKAGLQLLNNKKYHSYGLEQLAIQTGLTEKQRQNYKIESSDLGFTFSPILNSSGRISHANLSIGLLISKDSETATRLAGELIITNNDRKTMVKEILEDVNYQANQQFLENQGALWLEGDWNKGLVGLIASRLVSSYNLPVIVVSLGQKEATASLRAPDGYHLPKGMEMVETGLILKGGGHPGAAGFTAVRQNLVEIKTQLIQALQNQIENQQIVAETFLPQNYDRNIPKEIELLKYRKDLIWLDEQDLTPDLLKETSSLDPFGMDFLQPKFVVKLNTFGYKIMGKDFNSARILTDNFSFAAFNLETEILDKITKLEPQLSPKKMDLWVILKTSQNTWNNKTSVELVAERVWVT